MSAHTDGVRVAITVHHDGVEEERAAVVAWLRGRAVAARDHANHCGNADNEAKAWAEADECAACADAIERGEHRAGEVGR